jgi:tryptophan synthase alpha chain
MGIERFVKEAAGAGVDGLIVVDYPPEECEDFAKLLRQHGIDLVFLLAPTSTPERISRVTSLATGYIYYVSLRGVTGASHIDLGEVGAKLAEIRKKTSLPLGVGFGIRDGEAARSVCQVADAAIIGSRVIQEIESAPAAALERVPAFLRGVREAMDRKAA